MEPLPGVLSTDREKVVAVKNDIRWRNNLTSEVVKEDINRVGVMSMNEGT